MSLIYAIVALVCLGLCAFSVFSVYHITSARRRLRLADADAPPVTVLKPLCGADESLAENLETLFVQDYPDIELLFGVEGPDDPAAEVVRALQRAYPGVRSSLIIHDGGLGLNPKVGNLRAIMGVARHDVVVISDSNIAVPPDYVRQLAAHLQQERVGLVSNLFVGAESRSLGSRLESVHLAGAVSGSVAASALIGRCIAIGKSMMFRRSDLRRLGGMESLAAMLAEDYVLGRMFRAAGYEVRLAPTVIENVSRDITVGGFLRRSARWALLRSRLKPLSYPFEPLANPMAVALAAPLFGIGLLPALAVAAAVVAARDAAQLVRLGRRGGLLAVLALGPVKELLSLGVWAVAPFKRHVSWRGRRYRVSAGTRLYAEAPRVTPMRRVMAYGAARSRSMIGLFGALKPSA